MMSVWWTPLEKVNGGKFSRSDYHKSSLSGFNQGRGTIELGYEYNQIGGMGQSNFSFPNEGIISHVGQEGNFSRLLSQGIFSQSYNGRKFG